MDGIGFDATSWKDLKTFKGCCASPHDVDQAAAVFALGDTLNGRPMPVELPQPVIWWSDEGELAAVAVQAEVHETEDDETLEVLGLVLPDGDTVIALLEDVDLVDATDPVWLNLLAEAAEHDGADEDDDGLDQAWDDDELS